LTVKEKRYTRLDKIRRQVIRKELELSGIQDVRSKHKQTGSTISKEWTTPDSRNTPSITNLEEEEIVDALGNDGNASMTEEVKRPNPWSQMMMMMMVKEKLVLKVKKKRSIVNTVTGHGI
jgi:hypothetical protein